MENSGSAAFRVWAPGSGKKSPKHSSTTSRAPQSRQRRAIRSRKSRGEVRPVGLLGSQRNTMSTSGVMARRKSSPQAEVLPLPEQAAPHRAAPGFEGGLVLRKGGGR